jgi:hypothetical protein
MGLAFGERIVSVRPRPRRPTALRLRLQLDEKVNAGDQPKVVSGASYWESHGALSTSAASPTDRRQFADAVGGELGQTRQHATEVLANRDLEPATGLDYR